MLRALAVVFFANISHGYVPLGYIALHQWNVAKNYLNNAECVEFADNYVACKHESDPYTIPGTVASEPDGYFYQTDCHPQGPWNLARIQQDKATSTKSYGYDPTVEAVDIFVVDSFIDTKHAEFEGRARLGFKNIEGSKNQHGTHVASTIAGANFGVAKNANIISVQVLDDNGRGQWSGLLEGLSYISKSERTYAKSIIVNMSIGGSLSEVVNKAVGLLYKQGIIVVVAAGNSNTNACETSPAGAVGAIAVASSSRTDSFSSFSNYGNCVSIIAPGEDIKAAIPGGGYAIMTGTSMAAPHVSGVLANFMGSLYNTKTSPRCAFDYLRATSTRNAITGDLKKTENRFVYAHDGQYCKLSWLQKWMNYPTPPFTFFD